jgi:threonyl-tRNA synthetase
MSELLKITLPDGSVREVAPGTTPADIAAAIGPGLAKAALAARVDGELRDITRPLEADAQLALVTARTRRTRSNSSGTITRTCWRKRCRRCFRARRSPSARRPTTGSTTTSRQKTAPSPTRTCPRSRRRCALIAADKPLRREVWSREQLISRWKQQGETFKAEWAAELPGDEPLTVYWSGDDWLDMCRGPHLASTGKLDPQAFKLTRVSGAYWRGDQKNAMLSRIYGTGWLNKKQLDAHLLRLEEAAKRDHRKLGGKWTCSISSRKRTAACSGTPRASACGASSRPTCAARSTPPAIARSRPRR